MSDFLTWEAEIDGTKAEGGGGFILHEAGDYPFKVVKFDKGQVNDPNSNYKKGFMAKLELDVQGAKVFDNIILHKNFEWKIAKLFKSLGLMDFPADQRWSKVLGSEGMVHLKKGIYTKDGEDREKNDVDYYLEKDADTSFNPPSGEIPPDPQNEKLPWE